MTYWFGSDFHLGHKNVIGFCNRPFDNIHQMDEFFIERFKDQTEDGDVVYLLGDVQLTNHRRYLKELTNNSKIDVHLIQGNHDNRRSRLWNGWKSSEPYKTIVIDKQVIVLCHYPIESWEYQRRGAIHLHGHSHNNLSREIRKIHNRFDVGYDNIKDVLISYEDIMDRLKGEK